jgi:HlyD family secretion protein
MKRLLAVLIPIVVLIAGYFIWQGFKQKENKQSAYRMGVVDRGTVQMVVTATGTVSAVTTVDVGSQVSGTLKEIMVDYNSPVHKGQIVARLDSTFLAAAVAEAQANLERAEATKKQAERDVERVTDLATKNLAAQVDLDNAKTSLETAQASVRQMQAQLQRAKVNLDYSVITSPIDGVVISRSVDVGQTVAASLSAPTLFTIAQDLKDMQIETNIDEADIGKLEEGMNATFTVDSYPDLQFKGTISQIRYAAKTDQSVVTYPVILKVKNPDLKLRPGMTANVTVVTARRDDALRLPASATRYRPADYKPEKSNGDSNNRKMANDAGTPGSGTPGSGAPADSSSKSRRHRSGADSTGSTFASQKPSEGSGSTISHATVFVRNKEGKPEARKITIGLNDGSYVELISNDLQQGDSVIVGAAGTSAVGVKRMSGMGGGGPPR